MQKLLIFAIILSLTCRISSRKCDCQLQFTLNNYLYRELEVNYTNLNSDDNRDICDFKCKQWCGSEIRKTINNDSNVITNAGREKICETVTPNKSIIKDGITLSGWWDLENCASAKDQENVFIEDRICCRHCECNLMYTLPKELSKLTTEADFSDQIFESHNRVRAYRCENLNHLDECENDCRAYVAEKLNYTLLKNREFDNYDPLVDREDSNKICQVLNRTINSPGINLLVRYETGPRSISTHKDINLGNLCCNRTCNCEVVFKTKYKNLTNEECKLDIANRMPKRPLSYYCSDEVNECIDDCKVAAGLTLRNEPIKSIENSVLNLEIFRNFTAARKACMLYNKDALKPNGVEVYLRYSTGSGYKTMYPVI